MGLVRSASVVSLSTLASRVLGLVRDVMTAALIGAGAAWDAFVIAFTIPNLLRRLLGEGALSAAFIPLFAEELEAGGRDRAMRFFHVTFTMLVLVLIALVALGFVATLLVPTEAFGEGEAKATLTLELLRIMLPYMLLICAMALLMGVLNSLQHFFAPAIAPAVLNVCWIVSLLVAVPLVGDSPVELVRAVAVSVMVGGVLQVAVQIPALRAKGVTFAFSLDLANPAFRRMLVLMLPVVIGLAPVQLNIALDRFIAEWLVSGDGANSYLFYGNRLMQFPLALIGIAMGVAVFPGLSRLAAAGRTDDMARELMRALRVTLFLAFPATVGLAVLAHPLISVIYQHGRFGAEPTRATAHVLLCYAFGVFSTCGLQVVTRAFFALKDTKTPMVVTAATIALNLALNLALVWSLREAGLALATSITAAVNLVILTVIARRRLKVLALRPIVSSATRAFLASLVCGGVAFGTLAWLEAALPGSGVGLRLLRVLGPVVTGGVAFVGAAHLFRSPELRELAVALRRRRE